MYINKSSERSKGEKLQASTDEDIDTYFEGLRTVAGKRG